MGSRDGVLSRYGQERWYSEWTWPDGMVYRLDLRRKGGALTGRGQARWCTDSLYMGKIDNELTGHGQERWCTLTGHGKERWCTLNGHG